MPKAVRVINGTSRATVKERIGGVGTVDEQRQRSNRYFKIRILRSSGKMERINGEGKDRRELGKENECIMGKDEGIVALNTVRGCPGIGYTRYESKSDGNSRIGKQRTTGRKSFKEHPPTKKDNRLTLTKTPTLITAYPYAKFLAMGFSFEALKRARESVPRRTERLSQDIQAVEVRVSQYRYNE